MQEKRHYIEGHVDIWELAFFGKPCVKELDSSCIKGVRSDNLEFSVQY